MVAPKGEKMACQRSMSKKRKRGVTMSEKKNKYIISRDDKREREPML